MKNLDERLKFKKGRDIILFSFSIIVIITIFLISFFSNTRSVNKYVEIKYNKTILFDKDDKDRSTHISFPTNGIKKLTFKKTDSAIYNVDFIFDSLAITIYDDQSIQILDEDISCPDHICTKMGRIYASNTPIVCLPNMIQVMIVSSSFPESVN